MERTIVPSSLFLREVLTGQIVVDPLKRALAADPLVVQLTVTLGALALVSSASYHLVERPFLRLKERITSRGDSRALVQEPVVGRAFRGPAARGSEVPATILEAIGRASDAYAGRLSATLAALESFPRLPREVHRHAVEEWLDLAQTSKEGLIAAVSQGFERFERECRRALGTPPGPGSDGRSHDAPWRRSGGGGSA